MVMTGRGFVTVVFGVFLVVSTAFSSGASELPETPGSTDTVPSAVSPSPEVAAQEEAVLVLVLLLSAVLISQAAALAEEVVATPPLEPEQLSSSVEEVADGSVEKASENLTEPAEASVAEETDEASTQEEEALPPDEFIGPVLWAEPFVGPLEEFPSPPTDPTVEALVELLERLLVESASSEALPDPELAVEAGEDVEPATSLDEEPKAEVDAVATSDVAVSEGNVSTQPSLDASVETEVEAGAVEPVEALLVEELAAFLELVLAQTVEGDLEELEEAAGESAPDVAEDVVESADPVGFNESLPVEAAVEASVEGSVDFEMEIPVVQDVFQILEDALDEANIEISASITEGSGVSATVETSASEASGGAWVQSQNRSGSAPRSNASSGSSVLSVDLSTIVAAALAVAEAAEDAGSPALMAAVHAASGALAQVPVAPPVAVPALPASVPGPPLPVPVIPIVPPIEPPAPSLEIPAPQLPSSDGAPTTSPIVAASSPVVEAVEAPAKLEDTTAIAPPQKFHEERAAESEIAPVAATPSGSEPPLTRPGARTSISSLDAQTFDPLPPLLTFALAGGIVALGFAASMGTAGAGWRDAAWRLLRRLGLVSLFTRLTEAKVVQHPRRAEILEFARQNPGERVQVLRKALNLPNGVILHHLEMLQRHGQVRLERSHGLVRVFLRGTGVKTGPYVPPMRRQILETLRQAPGMTQVQISATLTMSPRVVSYHVGRLRQGGLLTVERDGVSNRCYAAEAFNLA